MRTPIGRHAGVLAPIRPDALLAEAIRTLMAQSAVQPERVEDVIAGCAYQAGAATLERVSDQAVPSTVNSMRSTAGQPGKDERSYGMGNNDRGAEIRRRFMLWRVREG